MGRWAFCRGLPFTRPPGARSVIKATSCFCKEYAWFQHLQKAGQAGDEGL